MVGFIVLMVVLYITGCSMQGNNGPANIVHTYFNSLQPHRSRSTLAQVRACCLMAANPFLNQCWLLIKGVLWHSPESPCTRPTGQDMHMNFVETLFWRFRFQKILPHLSGANELNSQYTTYTLWGIISGSVYDCHQSNCHCRILCHDTYVMVGLIKVALDFIRLFCNYFMVIITICLWSQMVIKPVLVLLSANYILNLLYYCIYSIDRKGITLRPGADFMNHFSIVIQIRLRFHSALIQIEVK